MSSTGNPPVNAEARGVSRAHHDVGQRSSALKGIFHDKIWAHIPLDDLSRRGSIVALYFADGASEDCRQFTETLIDFYNQVRRDQKQLEIVWISCDATTKEYEKTYKDMPWLALPLNDPERERLMKRYQVKETPALLFFDGATGDQIFPNGVDKVRRDPEGRDYPNKWHHL